ncbi:MAG: hypothetical protein M3072_15815 [Candidatus Dormibacteraeota bacterium]|nr:hypothetical protein [Candidatus Dormibacteraeota bacterium]
MAVGGQVVLFDQGADPEHVGTAEPVPGHALGRKDLGRAPGDRLQSGELGRREEGAGLFR